MRRIIVGTAGHIDHGKTRLVEALTGTDCDRWSEEKARGITIDLGFAHLESGDVQVGFVDVPGHERFLHNALAGLGGIRVMLLVVAADEGVKPQTREHLAICSLLGIPAALVALTKSDLVEPELLELARLEVAELLAGGPFAEAPILAVSSLTGDGIPELERRLVELAEGFDSGGNESLPARLPVDRAFHLKGLGLVVTGTLTQGTIQPGDALALLPLGGSARVRSIQVHGAAREEARAGERTAVQLTGVSLGEIARGTQLASAEAFGVTTSLAGRFTLLPDAGKPIRGSVAVRFHLLSSEVVGRLRPLGGKPLEPGDSGLVEIRLAHPVAAIRGDRFIIRRPSPAATLGGGEILDPRWRRRRGKPLAAAVEALLSGVRPALRLWAEEAGEAGLETGEAARRLGSGEAEVERELAALAGEQKLLLAPAGHGHGARWLAPAGYARVVRRAKKVLRDYFGRERLAQGMSKAEAVKRILPGGAAELADVYLGWLAAQKIVVVDGNQVNLPGRSAELSGEESKLSRDLLRHFDEGGLKPPSPADLERRLGAKRQILEGVLGYLIERGRLARLPGGLVIAASAIAGVRAELEASGWEKFGVPEFKQRFGLTRKWAIPILEHLDSIGVTRRVGDGRMVVRQARS